MQGAECWGGWGQLEAQVAVEGLAVGGKNRIPALPGWPCFARTSVFHAGSTFPVFFWGIT